MKTSPFSLNPIPFLAVAGLFLFASAAPAAVVTAQFFPSNASGASRLGQTALPGTTNRHQGQTFLATVSGPLAAISIFVEVGDGVGGEDVELEIYSLSGGLPSSQLGIVTIPEASIPNDALDSTDFTVTGDFSSQGIGIIAGNSYAIVAGTPTGAPNGSSRYTMRGAPLATSNYGFGTGLFSADGSAFATISPDFNFQVAVVPEPSRALLLGMGALGLIARRRRP